MARCAPASDVFDRPGIKVGRVEGSCAISMKGRRPHSRQGARGPLIAHIRKAGKPCPAIGEGDRESRDPAGRLAVDDPVTVDRMGEEGLERPGLPLL
jgi:hypothetical protein